MNNDKLIEYLQSCFSKLEKSREYDNGDSTGMTYLYFATIQERLSIHVAERLLNQGCSNPFAITLTQKNQNDLLDFRFHFDEALAKKEISSIASFPFPRGVENLSENSRTQFIENIQEFEETRGILNALLRLKNWAFFPDAKHGSKYRKRLAACYLKGVLNKLETSFGDNCEMLCFLGWCRKRTIKISSWRFKKKELRSPTVSALPIYKDEAAEYGRHFLHMACASDNSLRQHFAEMTIYLGLCFACARQHSNHFSPNEILKITKSSLRDMPQTVSSKPVKDLREKSKGSHDTLLLNISEDFLTDDELWRKIPINQQKPHELNEYCKIVMINDRRVLISQRLTHALELMGEFSLTYKDVENRLQEAFKVVGLSKSSGGISPRCFLYAPHFWEGVDVRKNWKPQQNEQKISIET